VDLHPAVTHTFTAHRHTSEYNTGANQVGEMFANYNLIAAPFFITTIAKYTSRKFTHLLHCYAVGLISIYFIQEPTVFTMEWLPMIGVELLGQVSFLFPMPCYQVHYLLTKWAITWEF
jgi:hypothetical protein